MSLVAFGLLIIAAHSTHITILPTVYLWHVLSLATRFLRVPLTETCKATAETPKLLSCHRAEFGAALCLGWPGGRVLLRKKYAFNTPVATKCQLQVNVVLCWPNSSELKSWEQVALILRALVRVSCVLQDRSAGTKYQAPPSCKSDLLAAGKRTCGSLLYQMVQLCCFLYLGLP